MIYMPRILGLDFNSRLSSQAPWIPGSSVEAASAVRRFASTPWSWEGNKNAQQGRPWTRLVQGTKDSEDTAAVFLSGDLYKSTYCGSRILWSSVVSETCLLIYTRTEKKGTHHKLHLLPLFLACQTLTWGMATHMVLYPRQILQSQQSNLQSPSCPNSGIPSAKHCLAGTSRSQENSSTSMNIMFWWATQPRLC